MLMVMFICHNHNHQQRRWATGFFDVNFQNEKIEIFVLSLSTLENHHHSWNKNWKTKIYTSMNTRFYLSIFLFDIFTTEFFIQSCHWWTFSETSEWKIIKVSILGSKVKWYVIWLLLCHHHVIWYHQFSVTL